MSNMICKSLFYINFENGIAIYNQNSLFRSFITASKNSSSGTQRFFLDQTLIIQCRKFGLQIRFDHFMLITKGKNKFFNSHASQIINDIKKKRPAIYRCHAFWKIGNRITKSCAETACKYDSFFNQFWIADCFEGVPLEQISVFI